MVLSCTIHDIHIKYKLKPCTIFILVIFLGTGGAWDELYLGVLSTWVICLLLWSVHLSVPGSTADCGSHLCLPDKESEDTHSQWLKICYSTGVYLKCRFCVPCSCHIPTSRVHQHQQWDILWRNYASSNHLSYSHVCAKGTTQKPIIEHTIYVYIIVWILIYS